MTAKGTVNSDVIIYNDLVQTAYLERIQDNIDVFGGSSNGAISIRNELIEGDFRKQAFYKFEGSVSHRNVNSDSTVDASKIGAEEMVSVKCPWKFGPFKTTKEAFKRRMRSPEEFSLVVGMKMADEIMSYWIQAALASLDAAISGDMRVGGSVKTSGKKIFTKGLRTMGDKFERIALLAMHSATFFDVVDEAINDKIFNEADIVIYGGQPGSMGKPILVTDKCATDKIFGLQPGAVSVVESQAPETIQYPINNEENISIGYRAEGAFNMELLGYSWEPTAGGNNPNLTNLENADNWEKYASSDKATAGFVIDLTASS